ncbi:MAG: transcription antitermination factor NusB [Candidatus Omnitrophica bacterium]|nr:transcription antitermination factor NusB [Candidatus Omnitrophota bacterium]
MRKRTKSREFALQVLYRMDVTSDPSGESLDNFWLSLVDEEPEVQVKEFTTQLVKGVEENRKVIDEKLSLYAANWQLERMAVVDRNILRMATYEILMCPEIPPKVSINEAIELAKKFSDVESSKFVNGILDKIKLEKNK